MRRLFVIVLLAGATTLFAAARARATCCTTSGDCPSGTACLGGACDATIVDCKCDTDCGPNLYCVPAVSTVCTQQAGSTTQDCHPQGQCMPAWKRPCATDVDCGPGGFTCVPNGRYCSGSDCQTTATCTAPPLPATCVTDADCPAAWTCEPDTALATACVPQPPHSCPSGGCPPTMPTGAKSCVPPQFDLVGLGGFSGPPVVLPASCPAKTGDGNTGADGAGAGGSGASASTTRSTGGGCQLAPGAGGDPASWVAVMVVGVAGAYARRRASRSRVRSTNGAD